MMSHPFHAKSCHRPSESIGSNPCHCLMRVLFQLTHDFRSAHKRAFSFFLRDAEIAEEQPLYVCQHIAKTACLQEFAL